jgi:hypothetical protein
LEQKWGLERKNYPTVAKGNTLVIVEEIYQKYGTESHKYAKFVDTDAGGESICIILMRF